MTPDDEEDEDKGFLQRRWPMLVAVVLVAGIVGWFVFGKKSAPKRRAPEISMVSLVPPPPPPPTPPPTPPPVEEPPPEQPEETIEQPDFQPEEKPVDEPPPDAPADEPPLGTDIVGDGADNGFGLAAGGGGGRIGGTGAGGGGSKFGWYAGKVQTCVVQALRTHPKTRSASMTVTLRIWADPVSGRITRAALSGSSGDPAVDRILCDEILTGLQLPEPPPADMPMPINLRISARRP